jgi:hypothetical protein
VGIASTGWALFGSAIAVPIDRVIANVEARLREDPGDVEALYTLARAHYLAFVNKSTLVPAYGLGATPDGDVQRWAMPPRWRTDWGSDNELRAGILRARAIELALEEMGFAMWSRVPDDRTRELQRLIAKHREALRDQDWRPDPPSADQLQAHVEAALDAFDAVIERSLDNGLYRLGLASLYDQYVQYRLAMEPPEDPRLQAIRPEMALDAYYEAYGLAVDADRSREALPLAGVRDLVSYEAGTRYLELAVELNPDPTAEERRRREQVRIDVDALARQPQRSITPLVLSFRPENSLAKLVDDNAEVYFDLDGNVSGAELDGLAVWFDRNGNGRSEPGEVMPIERLPVRALGTRPDGREGGGPRHSRGLVLTDGRALPTYDWIARRVETDPPCGGACASASTPRRRDRRQGLSAGRRITPRAKQSPRPDR